ncbi:MAG: sulfite exporter TauE/SafE family protein [Actinomycetota bacterium]|nr:sulfite exporter TauE/SafE family protein [Actinomycetota bacterium]
MTASHPAAISLARIGASAPLGFLIGLSLGTLGGGGSILAVPTLVYGAGEAAHAATTTSLIVVGSTALVGMVGHFRAGRVRLWPGLAFGLVGIGGSFLGSALNRDIPGDVLLLAFSGLILIAAWRMHRHHTETPCHAKQQAGALGSQSGQAAPSAAGSPSPPHARATMDTVVRVVVAGTTVGFLTGFFGVGGGFVIVPALVLALGYEMPIAVGTSLLVIAVSSAEGLVFRLSSGGIDWRVALPFTIAGIIGVLLGDRIAGRVPAAKLTRWFVWLLIAVAVYTAAQSLVAL